MGSNLFRMATVMRVLQAVGPATARLPEFIELFQQIKTTFSKKTDQETLQAAYDDLMAENTGGHARLQEKLAQAALKE